MSFFKNKLQNNLSNTQNSTGQPQSFEEKEIIKLMDILEQEFLNLQKINDYLKEKTSQVSSMSQKEYLKERKQM